MNYNPALVAAAALTAATFYPMNSADPDLHIAGGIGSYRFEMPAIITIRGNDSFGLLQATTQPERDLQAEFSELAQKWKEEIGAESSLSRITGNRHYLKIISLGTKVVPFILRDLKKEPAPWFLALRVLTDQPDVGKEASGNFSKMAEAWLKWGEENQHI